MNENNNYIDNLIAKTISGNATSKEIQELEEWKNQSEANKQLVQKSSKVWDKTISHLSENDINSDKSGLSKSYNHYLSDQLQSIKRKTFIYKLAAILTFPIALTIGWYFSDAPVNFQEAPVQLAQVTSPKGHVSKCVLPDGTQVWINTGSTITYDVNRFNKKFREVNLEGEAYFEVTSDKKKTFHVNTPVARINVTGTAFNVTAYPGDNNFETVLAEGSVDLQFKSAAGKNIAMKPGQRVIYNRQTDEMNVRTVDAEMFTSWRNGELLFKDATLNDLITELERIYDIEFHLHPADLGEFRFRGMFSYNNNLIEALEKIKRTSGIDYYIENKEVWLRKKN
ncbi:FecR family protein [Tangfeifania diversioriginum]|uniref:FecR family protein n=1 Tax=Tangfeifania diversioriginum TaxID=1168035 RepID=A0A1M6K8M8_9BACT|nr:FecR domain-containing protein [Tangfeifania diversioriginum]SHJ55274.1 FecR family protein [Tangfeifania diversioriginum]